MTSRRRFRIRTGLGRLLDVEHRSNRYIVAATVVGGFLTLIWRWATEADDPWIWAVRVGAAMFLAWTIGRELDPDDTLTAGAASLAVVPLLALGPPSIASSAAALVAFRVAVRTTGVSPHLIDGIVLTAFAFYLGTQETSWPALGVLILAVGTDRYAHPPGPVRTLWFALAMTAGAFIAALFFAGTTDWMQPTIPEWLVIGATAALGFLAIVNTQPPTSRADYHPGDLSETRLRFGRVLAVFTLVVGVVYVGGPTVPDLTPLWAAAGSVALLPIYRRATGRPLVLPRP